MKNIWLWIETQNGAPLKSSLELFTAARSLTGSATAVVLSGDKTRWPAVLGPYGAEKILVLQGAEETLYDSDLVTAVFSGAISAFAPDVVMAAANDNGKDLLSRLSAKFHGGYTANAMRLGERGENITCTQPVYGGGILMDLSLNGGTPQFLTIRPGVYQKKYDATSPFPQVEEWAPAAAPDCLRVKIEKVVREITENVLLEDAQVIVAGGCGMGSAERFQLVEQLADLLHGAVGATRPAIERGWVSKAHQVGQSGKIVAPKLYIACGISGAAQHVSAIMDSGLIVAVNNDENASIFEISDVGIVGDAVEILQLMIDEIKSKTE